jgi:L-lactate dehydrogenase complex protein LldG
MSDRAGFLANVRGLIGRNGAAAPEPVEATGLSTGHQDALAEAARAREIIAEQADALFDAAAAAAETAGWKVHRLEDHEKAAMRVLRILRERDITSSVLTAHAAVERAGIEKALTNAGIAAVTLRGAKEPGAQPGTKPLAFSMGAGITGADWFIAESGTLVLHPRSGVSRLVSLAPPVHIALLEKGQAIPSLDELFALERAELLNGTLAGSMNLITGPSRTGDIEGTIVQGIHGPIETHLLMIG